jgi:GNAT superfamily N-acetyltransferase
MSYSFHTCKKGDISSEDRLVLKKLTIPTGDMWNIFSNFSRDGRRIWYVKSDNTIVGWAFSCKVWGYSICPNELMVTLYIHPAHRRNGLGRALIAMVKKHQKKRLTARPFDKYAGFFSTISVNYR